MDDEGMFAGHLRGGAAAQDISSLAPLLSRLASEGFGHKHVGVLAGFGHLIRFTGSGTLWPSESFSTKAFRK